MSARVVDCQSHWHPRAYFDALAKRRGHPRARPSSDGGYVVELSERMSFPIRPLLLDLDQQLEDAHAVGIDVVVSSTGAFGVEHLPAAEAREMAELLNEEQARAQAVHGDELVPLARIPIQDPGAAIEVLDRAVGELGLRGVCIASNLAGESVAQERFRPVYERIERLGVPLFLHPTRGLFGDALERYGHEYVVGFMVDSSIAALDLVFSGVIRDFPGLRVVHPHVGGIVPYLAGRIDNDYRQKWAMGAELEAAPTEYLRSFYTDTVTPTPGALAMARDFYGADRLLFSSDYPYCSHRDGRELVEETLDEEVLPAVLGENALALLGLR
jgi:predicted TIM-barrel fold metal-dependent hydrolase